MTKLLVLHGAKVVAGASVASIGLILMAAAGDLGLPGGWVLCSLMLNVFGLGWAAHGFISSQVGGMNPPDRNSSKAYAHLYHAAHLQMHRAPNTTEMLENMTKVCELAGIESAGK